MEATNWEWINQTMTVTEGQHLTLKACLHIQDKYTHLWLFFCSEMRNKYGIFSVILKHKHIFHCIYSVTWQYWRVKEGIGQLIKRGMCKSVKPTSSWLCAGAFVVLVLMSQRVGTVSRLSVLMKDWLSAYSDSESAGEENKEFVERSSMQAKSWRQTKRRRKDGFSYGPMLEATLFPPVCCAVCTISPWKKEQNNLVYTKENDDASMENRFWKRKYRK